MTGKRSSVVVNKDNEFVKIEWDVVKKMIL